MENSRAEHIGEGLATAEFAELEARYIAALDARYNGAPSAAYPERDSDPLQVASAAVEAPGGTYTVPQILQRIADAAASLDYEGFCERIGEEAFSEATSRNKYAWQKWIAFTTTALVIAKLDGLLEKIIGEESK